MVDTTTNLPAELNVVQEEKDLGVCVLKPSLQCQRAAAKTMQVLGQIRRSFKMTIMNMFTFLYKMHVC